MAYKQIKTDTCDPYLEQLCTMKQDIVNRFAALMQVLKIRENEIIAEINRLEAEYCGYHNETESKLKEFHNMKKYADESIKDNETQSRLLSYIESNLQRINSTQKDLNSWPLPSVKWTSLGFEGTHSLMSQIQIVRLSNQTSDKCTNSERTMDEICSKRHPKVRAGKIGSGKKFGDLVHPNHIAIDNTSCNIYIADSKKHCLHLFSKDGKYLYAVPHEFKSPRAIRCRDEKLYVIENDSNSKYVAFKVLSFEGFLLEKVVGVFGKELGEFRITPSFDISEKGEWFVCDLKGNQVQVLSSRIQFTHLLGNSCLHAPTGIRIHGSDVFVLESPTYDIAPVAMKGGCSIKVFSEEGQFLSSFQLRDVKEAWYFDVDLSGRFVVSDFYANCVRILDKSGELLLKIGGKGDKEVRLNQPKGVVFTPGGDIACVSMNDSGCLQLF